MFWELPVVNDKEQEGRQWHSDVQLLWLIWYEVIVDVKF